MFTVIGESFTGRRRPFTGGGPDWPPALVFGSWRNSDPGDGIVPQGHPAAAVWLLAGIGVVIGTGYEATGIKLAVLAVFILVGVDVIENSSSLFDGAFMPTSTVCGAGLRI